MTYLLLDWPEAWDGGPGIPECEVTLRYLKTCLERWKVMRVALTNAFHELGEAASDKLFVRFRNSRTARIVGSWYSFFAGDDELTCAVIGFQNALGTQPEPMPASEYDPCEHLLIEDLGNGELQAIDRDVARWIYSTQLMVMWDGQSPVDQIDFAAPPPSQTSA